MKLKQLGSNITLLTLNNDSEILFSYETPVAGFDSDWSENRCGSGFFKTERNYSRTTTRHIDKYLEDVKGARTICQSKIDALLE